MRTRKRKREKKLLSIGLHFFLRRPQDSFFFSLLFLSELLSSFSICSYLAQLLEKVERLGVGSLCFVEKVIGEAKRVRNRLEEDERERQRPSLRTIDRFRSTVASRFFTPSLSLSVPPSRPHLTLRGTVRVPSTSKRAMVFDIVAGRRSEEKEGSGRISKKERKERRGPGDGQR